LTGGEFSLGEDRFDIVKNLKDNLANVTAVTNGSLLNKQSDEFYKYIGRMDVLFHSTGYDVYNWITKTGDPGKTCGQYSWTAEKKLNY
jgi:molybdenum cofactor biosynthesis enzyme MoaA